MWSPKAAPTRSTGTLYEFFRNTNLDARGFFDQVKPDWHQNQFGGTLGGPIRKDKTFFFASIEDRQIVQGIASDLVNCSDSRGAQRRLFPRTQWSAKHVQRHAVRRLFCGRSQWPRRLRERGRFRGRRAAGFRNPLGSHLSQQQDSHAVLRSDGGGPDEPSMCLCPTAGSMSINPCPTRAKRVFKSTFRIGPSHQRPASVEFLLLLR